jgi:predicted Na+-dependent transporter
VGLLVPPLAALFRDVVTITVAGLMTLVLLRVDLAQVLAYLRRPVLVAALTAWLLLALPVLTYAIAMAAGMDGPLGAALVISAMGCAATSSPAFARMVGLDGEISLVVAVVTTLLVPFTAPPLALGLMGIDLAISLPGLMGAPGAGGGLLRCCCCRSRSAAWWRPPLWRVSAARWMARWCGWWCCTASA